MTETGQDEARRRAALLVAHPDDETLWAGGMVLMSTTYRWSITALCRASDPDRAPRFHDAVRHLGASGCILDLDDGPEQEPLAGRDVEAAVLAGLGAAHYERIVTHSPFGEYTRHRRHEEIGMATARLWLESRIRARELWLFAYADNGGGAPPTPIGNAHSTLQLPPAIWTEKRRIVETCYGFGPGSFEHEAASPTEAFWRFTTVGGLAAWMRERQGQRR